MSRRTRFIVGVVGLCLLSTGTASAQLPLGARDLDASAVADSQAALRDLDAKVRSAPRNAAMWHRRGMIAWTLSIRVATEPRVRSLDANLLRRLADSSLRIAASLDPGSALYHLSAGVFLRDAEQPTARLAALPYLEAAVRNARTGTDSVIWTRAAVEAGRVHWLQYDLEVHRMGPCDGIPPSIDSASTMRVAGQDHAVQVPTMQSLNRLHNRLRECQRPPRDGGAGAYAQAEELFREAHRAGPSDLRAFRHVAMLLAARSRWQELEHVAKSVTSLQPLAAEPWLALGLALHRLGRTELADAAFDSAIARTTDGERSRLFGLTRVLTQSDSSSFEKSSAETRQGWERSYWTMADPLWSQPGNPVRAEFVARIAYAELRWTVEELGVRGADSDRGHIYIRYGPPDYVAALRGCDFVPDPMACSSGPALLDTRADPNKAMLPGRSDVVTYWDYDNGLSVVFWGSPSYGTARYPLVDAGHIAQVIETRPAAFDNLRLETLLDMPSGYARFRAPADSVDVFVFARAPVESLRRDAVTNAGVRADVWLLPRERPGGYHDTITLGTSPSVRRIWRVPPSNYLYRIEATLDGSTAAARAMTWFATGRDSANVAPSRGFGISDIVLAERVAPLVPAPSRWDDFDIEPVLGPQAARARLDLIWETYELSARGNEAAYTIEVTLQRERGAAGRIGAMLLGAIAEIAGVDRRDDRITFRYDRVVPPAEAIVDHLSLDLGETPSGTYRITVEVTDRSTMRTVSGASAVTIHD